MIIKIFQKFSNFVDFQNPVCRPFATCEVYTNFRFEHTRISRINAKFKYIVNLYYESRILKFHEIFMIFSENFIPVKNNKKFVFCWYF